ncbi:PTS transporter subunit EIIB [Escherichia coli]
MIEELVGGRGNIATVSHCITRLRFVLNQPANAADRKKLSNSPW